MWRRDLPKIEIKNGKNPDEKKMQIQRQRLTIEEMKEIARQKSGKCLSTKYINLQTKLRWQCAQGHIWKTKPSTIKARKTWCPVCVKNALGQQRRLTIEAMMKLAKERGGKCLSTEYVNAKTKLWWECSEGHLWKAAPESIKYMRAWCPACSLSRRSGQRPTIVIKDMRKLAKERGGKCLSAEYINAYTKLEWQCREGHTWMAAPNRVKNSGSWCLACTRERRGSKFTLKEMKELAKQRGGKCLSTAYTNIHAKLQWKCGKGHIWESAPKSVKHMGAWCPTCGAKRRGQKRLLKNQNFLLGQFADPT